MRSALHKLLLMLGKGRGHMVAAEKLHLLPAEEQEMIEEYLGSEVTPYMAESSYYPVTEEGEALLAEAFGAEGAEPTVASRAGARDQYDVE
ncbi:MAG: hypothetical protein LC776_18250 [Acidobacteria bacterium]|nr:hypothetical protein [Acidobacteriota bacterium]